MVQSQCADGAYDVAFQKVCFSYDNGEEVLHHISFTAPEGSVTALIGPSGSGKSTVANLIARFWDVSSGVITIGGRDIRELEPDRLLQSISAVFQENTLLSDTILNNIRVGKPDATMEEVIVAAKAACCHDFISKLPDGYNTVLAEGGASLSGGEKQRIAIARAILKNAPNLDDYDYGEDEELPEDETWETEPEDADGGGDEESETPAK